MEWRVLQSFRKYDSVKQTNRLHLRITNHYETCPRKVDRSNVSDWSIFHGRPERDHLEVMNFSFLHHRTRKSRLQRITGESS